MDNAAYEIIQAEVRKLKLTKDDSDDLVQDVCVRVLSWGSKVGGNDYKSFRKLVKKLLNNQRIDNYRRKSAKKRPALVYQEDMDGFGYESNPEEVLDQKRRLRKLGHEV